jgi:hypothetical protein
MKSLDKGLIEGNEKTESSFSDYKSVYRRSVNELKAGALGLCVLFAGGCAGALDDVITPQRVIGGAIQYRARTDINPNWGYNERVGADLIGGMIADSGNNRGHRESVGRRGYFPENVNLTSRKASNGYPFLFTGEEGFKNIGKQIFYPGEEIFVGGNLADILPIGTKIFNKNIYLPTGEITHFVEKSVRVSGDGAIILGVFDAEDLAKHFGTGEYENTWYYGDNQEELKKIGRLNYVILDNKRVENRTR